jgi:hypothetical protein
MASEAKSGDAPAEAPAVEVPTVEPGAKRQRKQRAWGDAAPAAAAPASAALTAAMMPPVPAAQAAVATPSAGPIVLNSTLAQSKWTWAATYLALS